MLRYTINRLLSMIPLMFGLSLVAFLYVNLAYFQVNHTYLSARLYLALAREGVSVALAGAAPWPSSFCALFLDLPFLLLFLWARRGAAGPLPLRLPGGRILVAAALAVLAGYAAYTARAYGSPAAMRADPALGDSLAVSRWGLTAFQALDLLGPRDYAAELERKAASYPEFAAAARPGPAPNFILVQVESLDAGVLGLRHRGREVTPFLNFLARDNLFYPCVLAYHRGGGTSDADFSVLNSLEPLASFPAFKAADYRFANALPRVLAAAGWRTAFLHANQGHFFNRDAAFPRMGFQEVRDFARLGLPRAFAWGAHDREFLALAGRRAAAAKPPFFHYLITLSSHEPFDYLPEAERSPLFADVPDALARHYLESMAYADRALAEAWPDLTRRKNTYLLVFGDHASCLPARGDQGAAGPVFRATARPDGQLLEFVPLIIVSPRGERGREDRLAASFLDIAPTVLAAAGAPGKIRTPGADLLARPLADGPVPFAGRKYLRSFLFAQAQKLLAPEL